VHVLDPVADADAARSAASSVQRGTGTDSRQSVSIVCSVTCDIENRYPIDPKYDRMAVAAVVVMVVADVVVVEVVVVESNGGEGDSFCHVGRDVTSWVWLLMETYWLSEVAWQALGLLTLFH
jgi:hypothetical protein